MFWFLIIATGFEYAVAIFIGIQYVVYYKSCLVGNEGAFGFGVGG
jgi:hypothetical protein